MTEVKVGMRLSPSGSTMVALTKHGILDIPACARFYGKNVSETIEDMIHSGWPGKEALTDLLELAERDLEHPQSGLRASLLTETEIEWAPCLLHPEKILCVGLNYRRHAEETGNAIPERPILFSKFNNALASHRTQVPHPNETCQLDYEAELAMIIGTPARNVTEEDALSYVFGYTVANDISARDLQGATSQWLLGKTCDAFAPIGPFVVTADEVQNPNQLQLMCERNGQIVQNSNTNDMIFSCRQIISYISRFMTLEPGDIILTGTPEGVIAGLPTEQQVWLRPGDKVVTTLEGLPSLEFTLVSEM